MEGSGDISRLFRNDQDRLNYYNLIRLIQDSNCSVFIGAGLSVHAGYPTSDNLIRYLAKAGNVELSAFSSLGDFSLKASQIKKLIEDGGNNFFEILYRRFDEAHFPINRTVPLYEDLVRIPFKSIVTTNYDNCIEEAAGLQNTKFQEVQIYPELSPNNLEAKKLYYIHGKIDHGNLAVSSESLVLTAENYSRAYGKESTLPVFVNSIFDSHNILFIGFGLEEITLEKLLGSSKRRKDFMMDFSGQRQRKSIFKFALLPMELKHLNSELQNPKEIERYFDAITRRDQELLNDYGVIVIRYFANQIYSEIKEIIKDIHAATQISTTKVEPSFVDTGVPV